MKITLVQLASYLQIPVPASQSDLKYSISIDTRTLSLEEPSIYIAIKGQRLDGHEFINQAIQNGAKIIIANKGFKDSDQRALYILVEDTEKALGKIAAGIRSESGIPWVAITGSAGKTTTRRFISDLLSMKGQVLETVENNNNQIGVPLTIFNLNINHRFVVIEAGTNHPGEIEYLANIIKPDIAVITNVGPTHIEFLGSLEGVAHEKGSLFKHLKKDGRAIYNADTRCTDILKSVAGKNIKTYGMKNADIKPESIVVKDNVTIIKIKGEEFEIPFVGDHYVYNFLAAYVVAYTLGFEPSEISYSCKKIKSVHGRLDVLLKSPIYLLDDSYNASFDSMLAAFQVLEKLPKQNKKIAVLGDMRELGDRKFELHAELVQKLNDCHFDEVIVSGECWNKEILNYKGHFKNCMNVDEVNLWCERIIQSGDQVLVKASRSLRYDLVAKAINEKWKGK